MMAGFVPRAAETSVVQTVTPSIRQMTDPLGETFHHGGMIYNGSRHVAPPVYDKLRFPAKGPMRGGDTVFKKYDELYDKVDLSKVAPNGPVPTVVPR